MSISKRRCLTTSASPCASASHPNGAVHCLLAVSARCRRCGHGKAWTRCRFQPAMDKRRGKRASMSQRCRRSSLCVSAWKGLKKGRRDGVGVCSVSTKDWHAHPLFTHSSSEEAMAAARNGSNRAAREMPLSVSQWGKARSARGVRLARREKRRRRQKKKKKEGRPKAKEARSGSESRRTGTRKDGEGG